MRGAVILNISPKKNKAEKLSTDNSPEQSIQLEPVLIFFNNL